MPLILYVNNNASFPYTLSPDIVRILKIAKIHVIKLSTHRLQYYFAVTIFSQFYSQFTYIIWNIYTVLISIDLCPIYVSYSIEWLRTRGGVPTATSTAYHRTDEIRSIKMIDLSMTWYNRCATDKLQYVLSAHHFVHPLHLNVLLIYIAYNWVYIYCYSTFFNHYPIGKSQLSYRPTELVVRASTFPFLINVSNV